MAEGGVGGRRQVDERAEPYSTGARAQSARLRRGGGRWKSDSCRRYELLVQQNISDLNEALNAPRVTRRAGRVLRHDMLRLAGRKAHQQLAEEAERGDGQLDRVQRFLGCLRTLGSSGQKSGQILLPDGTQAVLVDSSVLRAAEDAAREVQQATRDAVAVAVLQAEARVNASWEAAWREQKQQLRHERSRARQLGERMRSARALGRRAAALAHRCRVECKPVLDAVRRAEALSWETVQPLVGAVEGLEDEALALSDRAQEVFETVAKVNGVPEVEAPSSFPSGGVEWQEWEAEACYCAVEAPRREWVGWWREGQLVARQPTSSAIRVQAAVRGWAVRRRVAECVLDACSDGGDSDEYRSAEEDDSPDAGGTGGIEDGLGLPVWCGDDDAGGGAGWPRATVRASDEGQCGREQG